ncbi:MAG: hypothetical protein ABIY46_19365 [Gemmatimonadales bacterium]
MTLGPAEREDEDPGEPAAQRDGGATGVRVGEADQLVELGLVVYVEPVLPRCAGSMNL